MQMIVAVPDHRLKLYTVEHHQIVHVKWIQEKLLLLQTVTFTV